MPGAARRPADRGTGPRRRTAGTDLVPPAEPAARLVGLGRAPRPSSAAPSPAARASLIGALDPGLVLPGPGVDPDRVAGLDEDRDL